VLVALYNLGIFLGVPLAFLLNGQLIRRFKLTTIYILATVFQGLVPIPLIFYSFTGSFQILLLGVVFGLTAGFYWANRNFFTLVFTKSKERIYFSGLENGISQITNVFIPFLIGWFIVLGERVNLYSADFAYKLLFGLGIVILYVSGRAIKGEIIAKELKVDFIRLKLDKHWWSVRALTLGKGVSEGGLLFIPTLMILTIVGDEGALGAFKSASALIAAIAAYYVSKKAKVGDRVNILKIGLFIEFIAALTFVIFYSATGVALYFVLYALSTPFVWISISPIILDALDKVSEKRKFINYNYFFDIELFTNSGRVMGALVFLLLIQFAPVQTTLRFTPLILIILRFFIIPVANSLSRETHS
jgi:YQGE family putative transporter